MKEEIIADIERYNHLMSQSIFDKLWFVGHLEKVSTIVDFGCADGTLIECLANILPPTVQLIGFDINEEMLRLARRKCIEKINATFTSNWDVVEKLLDKDTDENSCLVLSSVIHEIYSYAQSDDEIQQFWNRVFKTGFNFIAIRDMVPSQMFLHFLEFAEATQCVSFGEDYQQIIEEKHKNNPALSDYKSVRWLDLNQPLPKEWTLDYLLHYQFYDSPNWATDVKEIYTPTKLRNDAEIALHGSINGYMTDLRMPYTLPYLCHKWSRDLGIDFQQPTHYKILLSKLEND